MSRTWFLALAVLASSLALVNARYHERRLFAQQQQLERASLKLSSDIQTLRVLLIELRAPTRLDRVAKEQIGMVPIRPAETLSFRLEERP